MNSFHQVLNKLPKLREFSLSLSLSLCGFGGEVLFAKFPSHQPPYIFTAYKIIGPDFSGQISFQHGQNLYLNDLGMLNGHGNAYCNHGQLTMTALSIAIHYFATETLFQGTHKGVPLNPPPENKTRKNT